MLGVDFVAEPIVWHQPVMVREVVEALQPRSGQVLVDGTVGTGGHAAALLPYLLPKGRLIALDRDLAALAQARRRLVEFESQALFVPSDFRDLPKVLRQFHLAPVDGLLLDLGMSSLQLDTPTRGFSFLKQGPLDMRMDATQSLTAAEIVNTWPETELADLLWRLGEERFSRRIASCLVAARRQGRIDTTAQLIRLIVSAMPPQARHGRVHAATRTFQALRMAVNDELGALETLLKALPDLLAPQGRAAIISFHSLEDRLVKRAFQEAQRSGWGRIITKKPVVAGDAEQAGNSRARSAKLRALERL